MLRPAGNKSDDLVEGDVPLLFSVDLVEPTIDAGHPGGALIPRELAVMVFVRFSEAGLEGVEGVGVDRAGEAVWD